MGEGRRRRRVAAGAGLSLGATLGMSVSAEAADFTVQNTNDAGAGSLRAAITAANNGGGNDRILFRSGLTGTITVETFYPQIDEPLRILGPGAAALTVSGADAGLGMDPGRILYVNTNPGDDVAVSGLKLDSGNSGNYAGGAIFVQEGDLTIERSTLSRNVGDSAGAIYSSGGPLVIRDSVLSGNKAADGGGGAVSTIGLATTIERSDITGGEAEFGGALYTFNGAVTIRDSIMSTNQATSGLGGAVNSSGTGPLTIERSDISGNTSTLGGGGVYAFSKDVNLRDSNILGNIATAGPGGGLNANSVTTDELEIERSTFSGNRGQFGGGIYSFNQERTIETSTISGNTATTQGGGGLVANDGELTVRNSTFARNSAPGYGGGIYSYSNGAPVLQNTILADNSAALGGPDLASPSDIINASFSLIETTPMATLNETVPGSNLSGDPKLGPLANNGGRGRTHSLLPGSRALDKGSSAESADQRGAQRPFNQPGVPSSGAAGADGSDIGAYERMVCAAVAVNRIGTIGKDRLVGTAGADGLLGRGGNDLLLGKGGNDALCGGGGRDKLKGGKGRDKLRGGGGRDRLIGGPGRDRLRGGPGRDTQRQ